MTPGDSTPIYIDHMSRAQYEYTFAVIRDVNANESRRRSGNVHSGSIDTLVRPRRRGSRVCMACVTIPWHKLGWSIIEEHGQTGRL